MLQIPGFGGLYDLKQQTHLFEHACVHFELIEKPAASHKQARVALEISLVKPTTSILKTPPAHSVYEDDFLFQLVHKPQNFVSLYIAQNMELFACDV